MKSNAASNPDSVQRTELREWAVLYAAVGWTTPGEIIQEAIEIETGFDEVMVRRGIESSIRRGLVERKRGQGHLVLTPAGDRVLNDLQATSEPA